MVTTCFMSETCARMMSIIAGNLGIMMSGTILSFWSYMYALKKQFNYTQITVEMIRSVNTVTAYMGLPAGVLFEYTGPIWTSFIALCLNVSSFLLLYSTTLMPNYYHSLPWLQCLYFAMSGLGSICMYISCLKVGVNNFGSKHRAKAVSVLNSSYLVGPAMFSLLYGEVFVDGDGNSADHQNLGGFYILYAVAFGLVGIFCIFFLRDTPMTDLTENSALIQENDQPSDSLTGLRMIRRLDFQCCFWTFLFLCGPQLMVLNNQSICLKSFGYDNYTTIITTIAPLPAIISGIVVGVLSDSLLNRVPRSVFVLLMGMVQTVVLVIATFFSNNLVVFIILVLTMSVGDGIVWLIMSAIVSECYGMYYFPRNFGAFMFGVGLWTMVIQEMFGWIYENGISETNEFDCYGLHCFTWSFVMCAIMSFFSVLLIITLLYYNVFTKKHLHNQDMYTLDSLKKEMGSDDQNDCVKNG